MDDVFGLGVKVKIKVSGEAGEIVGCAHYQDSERQSLVRYRANDGRAVQAWWSNSALEVVPAS